MCAPFSVMCAPFSGMCAHFPEIYIQGTHSNCIFKFPVFSMFFPLSDHKFSLCQFTWCVTVKYTLQTHAALKTNWKFLRQIQTYIFLGNLFQFLVFSLTGNLVAIFPVFSVQWVPCVTYYPTSRLYVYLPCLHAPLVGWAPGGRWPHSPPCPRPGCTGCTNRPVKTHQNT